MTSRSFVAVIQELHQELLMPVIVFYLVLRALDTIEDDMTIRIEEKEPLLRNFYARVDDESWTFDGNGPEEKDREVLVKFDCVAREFNKLKDEYKVIIQDIAKGMGNGMADFATMADGDANGVSVKTIQDYKLYCHYVAGLVGEGLTRLFVKANFVDPALLVEKPELMESMGRLLQQTNIIRDVREDYDDKRCFWPKEVWSKYVENFSDIFLPQNREKALHCSSEMILMALNSADECLSYMAGVKEQSTFNFVAIPQSMAIATLELCFQNPAMFDRNIKITRGTACQIMNESTKDFQHVCELFRRYARKIHRKNKTSDPHFFGIGIACCKIERFVATHFPDEATKRKAQEGVPEAKMGVMYLAVAILGLIMAVMVRDILPHLERKI
jgi:farnesyl-diphosphate farnesyltransferase